MLKWVHIVLGAISYALANYLRICVKLRHIELIMPGSHRSAFAYLRCGVAPIRIGTGRYENLRLSRRLCLICPNSIENEAHVMLYCPLYWDLRLQLFTALSYIESQFEMLTDQEKLISLFYNQTIIRKCAKTCYMVLLRRAAFLHY